MLNTVNGANQRKLAIKCVILMGVVSLFADMTYEGARSITGPFLGGFGASATVVGVIAGLGELISYAFRLVSGYFSDRTGKYWTFTIAGYFLNLVAVPMLALSGRWEMAAGLIVMERFGKAVRNPARDTILSHATRHTGRGWGFGLHEAMDQVGAVLGPLIVTTVLASGGTYRHGFMILGIPAVCALIVLIAACIKYPSPRDFEMESAGNDVGKGYSGTFWMYMAAVAFIAAGFADFPLIAFHLGRTSSISPAMIPVIYAVAMGFDAVAAVVFGYLFDRLGFIAIVASALLSALFAPLVFLGSGMFVIFAGMALWGISMGAQESVMRAAIANMIPAERRGTAYGVFNAGFGIAWFMGSALMGVLYDRSVGYLVIFSIVSQVASIPLFVVVSRSSLLGEKHL